MLLTILQRVGKASATEDCPAPKINNTDVEKSCFSLLSTQPPRLILLECKYNHVIFLLQAPKASHLTWSLSLYVKALLSWEPCSSQSLTILRPVLSLLQLYKASLFPQGLSLPERSSSQSAWGDVISFRSSLTNSLSVNAFLTTLSQASTQAPAFRILFLALHFLLGT